MGRRHVLVGLLVVVVLGRIEGEGGVYWDGRGGRVLLHLADEGVFVRVVEGDGLGGVGLLVVLVLVVVGRLGEEVVCVSERHGRHGGRREGVSGN